MTAFSRVTLPAGGKKWVVEIRSLNQRYFELSLRVPPLMYPFESQIRQLIQSAMRRGKVVLNISEEGQNGESLVYELDLRQAEAYLSSSKKVKQKFRLQGELGIEDLMRLPGVVREKDAGSGPGWTWPKLSALLKKTLHKAICHKEEEGKKITKDFLLRLDKISRTVQRVETLVKENQETYFKKLKMRLQEILHDEKIDEERLYREVAFLAERSDITEEVVRMKSHLELFGKWLSRQGEIGRELDFLCQEMNREANTMASKAQLFEVSQETIAIKSEIEKIREQVQNVE